MRYVLAGAGMAVLLGMVSGIVGWRWAQLWPRNIPAPTANSTSRGAEAAVVNITTFPPARNGSGVDSNSRNNNNNSSSSSSSNSSNNNSSSNSSSNNSSSSSNSSNNNNLITTQQQQSSPTITDPSPAVNTTETTDFFNESYALNSSLFQDNNYTEISFDGLNQNSSLATNSTEDDVDYVKMGQELLTEATTILDTGIWDFERRTEDGDAIFSRQLDNGNMVYRLTGIVDMPPQDLLVIIWDGLADYPKWNPTLLECRVLEKINDQTDISYTVSAPGARGYVASRDFVSLRHWELRHNTYIAASKSIDFTGAPSNPDYIRGKNGPGCMELRSLSSDPNKTEFRWLLNTKLNGWIPSYIADKAYKKFMTKYMIFLRDYCKIIKQRATYITLSSTTPKNITD